MDNPAVLVALVVLTAPILLLFSPVLVPIAVFGFVFYSRLQQQINALQGKVKVSSHKHGPSRD